MPLSVVLNSTGFDSLTIPLSSPQKFFRVVPYHAANEACNNNIKRIRFAQLLCALNEKKQRDTALTEHDLLSYLNEEQFPRCPSNNFYVFVDSLRNPSCATGFHPFEEQ
jgi:hypothetical protein